MDDIGGSRRNPSITASSRESEGIHNKERGIEEAPIAEVRYTTIEQEWNQSEEEEDAVQDVLDQLPRIIDTNQGSKNDSLGKGEEKEKENMLILAELKDQSKTAGHHQTKDNGGGCVCVCSCGASEYDSKRPRNFKPVSPRESDDKAGTGEDCIQQKGEESDSTTIDTSTTSWESSEKSSSSQFVGAVTVSSNTFSEVDTTTSSPVALTDSSAETPDEENLIEAHLVVEEEERDGLPWFRDKKNVWPCLVALLAVALAAMAAYLLSESIRSEQISTSYKNDPILVHDED